MRNWREKIEFRVAEFGKSENYAELGNFSCDFYVNLSDFGVKIAELIDFGPIPRSGID